MIPCRFSAGLDDLTRKQQADPAAVLRVLHRTGRFSVFEATANITIARTMTALDAQGLITVDTSPGYPWSNVTLSPLGLARIGVSAGGGA
jgi:hypothetical protein